MIRIAFQFLKYCFVGALGAFITSYGNLFFQGFGLPEYVNPLHSVPVPWALGFAIVCALLSNFTLNKVWTFHESAR